MDIEEIKRNYAKRSDEGLHKLLSELSTLRADAIVALKDELSSRNDEEGVRKVDDFLTGSVREFTTEDAKEYIRTELANGQSLDVIRLELMAKGINVFDIRNKEEEIETDAFNYLTDLKKQGLEEDEIREQLNQEFEVVEGKEDEMFVALRRKGRLNIMIGIVLLLISCFLLFGSFYLRRLSLTMFLAGGVGIWRLTRGINQLKR